MYIYLKKLKQNVRKAGNVTQTQTQHSGESLLSRSQINAVAPLPDKNSVSNFCTEVVLALPDCLAEGKVLFLQRYDIAGLSITVVGLCSSCLMCIASSHRSSSSGRRASTHASGLMKADGGRFDWESCVRSPGGLLK